MDYKRKIDFAIKLLREIPKDGPLELSYSGGKDSDVCLRLAQMAGIKFEPIYKNTTIDPPGTIAHCKENGATILPPKMTFAQLLERKGMPGRFRRFCCAVLKEYKVYDRAIQGVRRDESTKRAANYKEPEICRVYSAKEKVRVYLPILEWTTEDVERFILEEGIKCAPLYYDEGGNFHAERRLGCLGCPLRGDMGLGDYKKYPKLLAAHIKALNRFYEKPRNAKIKDAYTAFLFRFFCEDKYYDKLSALVGGGLFPEIAETPKEYLERYFGLPL